MTHIYIRQDTFLRLLGYKRRGATYSELLDDLMDWTERDWI